mmetsp:Transcript_42016/g.30233  ORF Transcript_42016/g.30233 Transcript_42016/m.30233 type:complete len:184 (+) Transcript_42016:25-576(+)
MIDSKCLLKVTRIFNIITVLFILAAAIVRFTEFSSTDESDPFFYLLTLYLIPFGLLLLVAEFQWERILVYLEFLSSQPGKGLYLVFVGLLLFDKDRSSDMVFSVLITFVGIWNMLLSCIVPALIKIGKDKGQLDDDDEDNMLSEDEFESGDDELSSFIESDEDIEKEKLIKRHKSKNHNDTTM